MKCFRHNNTDANGICKACYKAVCQACAIEFEFGIACSEDCKSEAEAINEMTKRGKKLYGIGKSRASIPATGVIVWGLLSFAWWIIAIAQGHDSDTVSYSSYIIAIVFTVITAISYYHSKRTGLNC